MRTDSLECPPGEFKCYTVDWCIYEAWLCDGELDCADNSDELPENCPEGICSV